MKSDRVLMLDVGQATELRNGLSEILEREFSLATPIKVELPRGQDLLCFNSYLEALVRRFEPRVIFLISPGAARKDSTEVLGSIKRSALEVPVIVAVEDCAPEQALELLDLGAADFVIAPFQATDVLARAWKQIRQSSLNQKLTSSGDTEPYAKRLIGTSQIFLQQVSKIPLIARSEANVLIIGETGTGKELYARAIHYGSGRAGKPFMPVNCGAIPIELVENELFGHRRGAFTSASHAQIGLIEEAHGGTLFLDEIDCLPIFAQVKLLRFLQEKEYRPLGSARMLRADVRIVAASNLNLEEAVGKGKLRQDLFYRLNIISVSLPPLRERREDIPALANHFLAKYAHESRQELAGFSPEALHLLMVQTWCGNVRELEHAIQRAIVLCEGKTIEADDLILSNSPLELSEDSLQEAKAKEIARFEKNYIQAVLAMCKGNITRAAHVARKNRRAFWQLIRKHQIDVSSFKQPST